MALSKQRQGELALLMVKNQIKKSEIPAPDTIKRNLGNLAKEINVELTELIEFAKPIYEEALNEGFGKIIITPK